MLRHLLLALFTIASLHAEEPVLPPEAKPLFGEAHDLSLDVQRQK